MLINIGQVAEAIKLARKSPIVGGRESFGINLVRNKIIDRYIEIEGIPEKEALAVRLFFHRLCEEKQ